MEWDRQKAGKDLLRSALRKDTKPGRWFGAIPFLHARGSIEYSFVGKIWLVVSIRWNLVGCVCLSGFDFYEGGLDHTRGERGFFSARTR